MSATGFNAATWREVEAYFDQVLDLEYERRADWLTQLSVTEPRIAQTLHELLGEYEALRADGFLEHALPGLPAELTEPETSLAGTDVGSYKIERLLGRGGMGEVWLAARSDGRFEGKCAIKFLDSSPLHRNFARRFHQEGQLLARLVHPNIARLLDAGTTEEGTPFLVLEYVDGERIDRYCEAHRLGVRERVRLFLDAVAAVAHAHDHLIIHRDLKPSNVLVTREGVVKLLDFGIAKLLSPQTEIDAATRTRFENAMLTPEYAAPEQLLADLPRAATDTYQLGMLLYVLLTGGQPLQTSGPFAERIKRVLECELPQASDFAKGAIRKQIRGDLDAILAMALRKDPSERYLTAAALHDDLVRYLEGQPVLARRGAALYVVRKFVVRHRSAVLASILTMGALCTAILFAFQQMQAAKLETNRTQAVNDFVLSVFSSADPSAGGGSNLRATDLLKNAISRVDHEMAGQVDRQIPLYTTIGQALLGLNAYRESLEAFDKARFLAVRQSRETLPIVTEAELGAAEAKISLGEPAAGRELLDQIEKKLSNQPPSLLLARTWRQRAHLAIEQDSPSDAVEFATRGTDLTRKLVGKEHREYLDALSDLIGTQYHADRCDQAMPNIDYVLEKFPLVIGAAEHPQIVLARAYRARCLGDLKRYDEAIAEFQRNESSIRTVFGSRSKYYATELYEHAVAEYHRGGFDAAIDLAHRHLEIMRMSGIRGRDLVVGRNIMALFLLQARYLEKSYTAARDYEDVAAVQVGGDSWNAIRSRAYLALVRGLRGETDQAVSELRELMRAVGPDDNWNNPARIQTTVAWLQLLHGDPTAAQKELQSCIPALERRGTREDVTLARARGLYGLAYLELGSTARAREQLTRGANELKRLTPLPTPDQADLWVGLARMHLQLNELDSAIEYARMADEFWTRHDPASRWAGEAAYWHGESLRASGMNDAASAAFERARRALQRSPFPPDKISLARMKLGTNS